MKTKQLAKKEKWMNEWIWMNECASTVSRQNLISSQMKEWVNKQYSWTNKKKNEWIRQYSVQCM